MRAESNIKPIAPYEITFDGEFAEVVLFENLTEVPGESNESTKWAWDEYRISVKNRAGLVDDIERGFYVWLQAAKDLEYSSAAAEVRLKRNALIAKTDYIMLSDYTMSDKNRQAYADYRQALRDITEQDGFPFDVVFPAEVEKQLESEK